MLNFDLKVELYNISSGNKIVGFGTAYYDLPTVNATEEHLNKMYQITLKNAVYACFSRVKEF